MAICRFEYAAKIVCGDVRERGEALAPGHYVTEVNVYNPNERPVRLRKRLVVTVPPGGQQENEASLDESHVLGPERALAVDCRYLGQHVRPGPFFIGFLVIESTESVDVTAVYTTAGFEDVTAPAIAVERVKERSKVMVDERD